MARFLKDEDYDFQIKNEILKLLNGSTPELASNIKLLKAEQAGVAQIKNRLSGRFDCDAIFNNQDNRDMFIVMILIDITLYHLYSQTGNKDVPEHRQQRYQDAIEWLRDASLGKTPTNLPSILSDDFQGDIRIWSAGKPENNDW